jgi:hypothetical protein
VASRDWRLDRAAYIVWGDTERRHIEILKHYFGGEIMIEDGQLMALPSVSPMWWARRQELLDGIERFGDSG